MNKRRADRLKGLPNVVVVSAAFRPSQGGIERVSEVIAQGLRNRGFQVKILTLTALTEIPRFCSSKFPTLGRSAA